MDAVTAYEAQLFQVKLWCCDKEHQYFPSSSVLAGVAGAGAVIADISPAEYAVITRH